MSRIGLHPDGLCDQCEIPETVKHFIEVCPKFTEARRRLKHAVEDLGINFSTPEILRSTAAAKHVEAFVRESGIRIKILFTPALALQDLAVIQCHSPLHNNNNNRKMTLNWKVVVCLLFVRHFFTSFFVHMC